MGQVVRGGGIGGTLGDMTGEGLCGDGVIAVGDAVAGLGIARFDKRG